MMLRLLVRPAARMIAIPRTQVTAPLASPLQARWGVRTLATEEPKDDKKQQPQLILNDDMLAKAGFEDPQPKAEGQEGADATLGSLKRRKRAQTSKDRQRERAANWFYIAMGLGAVVGAGYLLRNWDDEEEQKKLEGQDIANGYTPQLMYDRFNKRVGLLFTFFLDPVFEDLLPPPAPEAYRRPLTLVLSLDDLLIHSSWDTQHGWRTAKRPGVDYFLGYLSQYYEIVVFGLNYQMYSEKAVNKLDPYHAYISYQLYREACRYKDGKLIKDLSLLNRDLAKTVLIDTNPEAYFLHEENAIPAKPWNGDPNDTYLIDLIPFLEFLATQNVKDVRPILSSFNKEFLIEEYQKRELALREKWKKENPQLFLGKGNAGSFIGSLLGMPQLANKEPKHPLDLIREHGQLQYKHFQEYLNQHAQKILEDEKKLKEEFGKITLNKYFSEGQPSPEEIAKRQQEILAGESKA
ncbi:HAD family hydrolase [Kocuria palustris]|nr:HAD family hydrolase [Kocuria palustris]